MSCPKSWSKLRKALKNKRFRGANFGLTEDAPGIIRRWYNALVRAERAAYESVGLGTLADMNAFIRRHTIENPRFIFDVAVTILSGGDPFQLILRRVQNDERQDQARPIPEHTIPRNGQTDMSKPFLSMAQPLAPKTIKLPSVIPDVTTNTRRKAVSQPPARGEIRITRQAPGFSIPMPVSTTRPTRVSRVKRGDGRLSSHLIHM